MSMRMDGPVLVTGATGFVGSAVCAALAAQGTSVRAALRRDVPVAGASTVMVGECDGATDWRPALRECTTVIHSAARAHIMREKTADPFAEFRRVNVEATLNLARQAAKAGVKRFVFISSAKVMGEGQALAYTDSSLPAPEGPYAISKWEAEQGLAEIAAQTGMELVILRPPLIYGPGVKANFLSLMRAVERSRPLPFGRIENRRSLLGLDNLVDALLTCCTHPAAANRCFLVADSAPISTPQLVREIATALGRTPRLVPIPTALLRTAGLLTGKRAAINRLLGSFAVDASGMTHTLGWHPPHDLKAGLKKTANWFRAEYSRP